MEPLLPAKCHLGLKTSKSSKSIGRIFSLLTDIDLIDELITYINFLGGGVNVCNFSMPCREVPFNFLYFLYYSMSRKASLNLTA